MPKLISLVVSILLFALSVNGQNLVLNPSFEADENRDDRPDEWNGPLIDGQRGGAIFMDRALPMNGSIQLTAVFQEEGEHVLAQEVTIRPYATYTLSCWIRGRAAKGNAWARIRYAAGDSGEITVVETEKSPQGHSDWTLYQKTFTSPPNPAEAQVEIVWRLKDQGLFRFDFVSLVEGTIALEPPNTPPRVRGDHFKVPHSALFGIASPGLFENDTDADGDILTLESFEQAAFGQVNVENDGAFTYRPNLGFKGSDSFIYRASDGRGGISIGEVEIEVSDFPAPKNLIRNGSFEDGVTPLLADEWSLGTNYHFERDRSHNRSGKNSLQVSGRKTPQFARQEKIAFRSGYRYRLSAWIKGENVKEGEIALSYVMPEGRRLWNSQGLSGSFDWRKISLDFGSALEPVENGSVDILAKFTSGQAWIDDVTVEEFPFPIRIIFDGHSVSGGVLPILREFGRDALQKGITDRELVVKRSPEPKKEEIKNSGPHDLAMLCTWCLEPGDKWFPDESRRFNEWKDWFSKYDPSTRLMIFHWQPWGTHLWPEGFAKFDKDYRQVSSETGLPLISCTLAFKKFIEQSEDQDAALRLLYSADYHHASRVGNYLKACCAFAAATGKSPVGLTHVLPIDIDFGWPPETLNELQATRLQQAACTLIW